MPSPTGIRQRRPDEQQQAARRARDHQRPPRAGAIDHDAGRDQRDGVAERGRVDERPEARRREVVAVLQIGADHAEAPLHDRDRRLAGERQDQQPAGIAGERHSSSSAAASSNAAQNSRQASCGSSCGAASSRSTAAARGRCAPVARARSPRIASDERAAPLPGGQLVGERRHGARVRDAERVARIACGGREQQRAPHRAAQLVLVDADRSRRRTSSGGPARVAHSLSGYEASARSMSRSSVTDADGILTPASRLAAPLTPSERPSVQIAV